MKPPDRHVPDVDLVRYVYGGGDVPYRDAIRRHLDGCVKCAGRFRAERRRAWDDLRVAKPEHQEATP
jgi:hypothetical protein